MNSPYVEFKECTTWWSMYLLILTFVSSVYRIRYSPTKREISIRKIQLQHSNCSKEFLNDVLPKIDQDYLADLANQIHVLNTEIHIEVPSCVLLECQLIIENLHDKTGHTPFHYAAEKGLSKVGYL